MKQPSAVLRWSILLFISLGMFGNYYIYDSISPLADMLKSQLGFSDSNIGSLYSIYSIPNIFMVLVGGLIIDRIGTRKSALIFAVLVLIGSMITAWRGNIITMITGRLIFGLGAESMIVAINTIVAKWFKGKTLSFAFGLNLTVARLGSWLALNSPSWAKNFYDKGWQGPLQIAILAGIISLVCLVIYAVIEIWAVRRYDLEKEAKQEKIQLKDALRFGKSYWYITLLCIVFYSAMFPFQTFAVKFFEDVHHAGRDAGGFLSSILTVAAMIFTPLFGLLSDKIGKRSLLMMLGSLLIVPVYLMMGYKLDVGAWLGLPEIVPININFLSIHVRITSSLIIPMAMMGISFSLIPAIMWPSVAIIVEKSRLGTAYGLMNMIQNIGLAGFNLIIGYANDISHAGSANPKGYLPGMWIFSLCGFFGLLFAFLLRQNEKKPGGHGLDKAS